jgi:hypothetical protein
METNDLDGFMAQMRGPPRSHKQESTTSEPAGCQDARVRQSTKASAGGDDVVDDLRRGRRLTFAVPSKPYSGLTTVGRSQVEENQQVHVMVSLFCIFRCLVHVICFWRRKSPALVAPRI